MTARMLRSMTLEHPATKIQEGQKRSAHSAKIVCVASFVVTPATLRLARLNHKFVNTTRWPQMRVMILFARHVVLI
jgi:hypothetical protein